MLNNEGWHMHSVGEDITGNWALLVLLLETRIHSIVRQFKLMMQLSEESQGGCCHHEGSFGVPSNATWKYQRDPGSFIMMKDHATRHWSGAVSADSAST